jgi:GNAT superfamily N-acetyltransferase
VTSRDVTEEWREWGGPTDAALVRMLHIAPEFQRRGIGRRLLRRLRRRRMAASIGLHVFEVNRAGIAFWEREGFRRGNLPAVPSTGGAPLVRLDWWRGMPRHESAATDGQRRGLA